MRLASARPRRRLAAIAVLAMTAGLATHGIGAGAQAPTGQQFPDFGSTSGPYQDSVQTFGYQVVTGGFSAGTPLSFRFHFHGVAGDRAHAVSFGSQSPAVATTHVSIVELPTGAVPGTGCLGITRQVNQAVANPYTQTISVVPNTAEAAGQALDFCFSNLVGFPLTPGDGYSIDYTEPGGTVPATYSLLTQQNTPPASASTETVTLYDGTTDVTDSGVSGSPPGVYGVSYRVVVKGDANGTYHFTSGAFDSVTFESDTAAKAPVTGTSSALTNPTCTPMLGTVCTDANGQGTATLVVDSGSANPDYVVIGGTREKVGPAQTSDEKTGSLVSITVGPAGAPPPPAATPTPLPTPTGTGPAPASTFDPDCPGANFPSRGVGSREVFDEASQVLFPAASVMCQPLSHLVSYLGLTDTAGLKAVLSDYGSSYAFAGLDRPLSSAEEKDYAPGGANTISQIPISVEPVVVSYNLDANGCHVQTLTLRSQVLSLILMGRITSWDDTLLQQDNPALASCHLPILVAHDIGVTSSILKDYLSKRNPQWTAYRQPQLAQAWPGSSPVSCTANGSRPMALCVAGRPGTLGYGFYRSINEAGLPVAQVDGPAGAWDNHNSILDGCTAAAGTQTAANPFAAIPPTASGDWGNTSLTDTAQPGAYPICSFDFLVAATGCRYSHSIVNYHALVAFFDAVLSDYTQQQLPSHGFAPLPPSIQSFSSSGAKLLTCP